MTEINVEEVTYNLKFKSLAIPCELPELQTEEDVVWIYEKLQVHLSEDEAATHFRKTLDVALATRFTRLNDVAHMLAHA